MENKHTSEKQLGAILVSETTLYLDETLPTSTNSYFIFLSSKNVKQRLLALNVWNLGLFAVLM